jgi:hypothetical protein
MAALQYPSFRLKIAVPALRNLRIGNGEPLTEADAHQIVHLLTSNIRLRRVQIALSSSVMSYQRSSFGAALVRIRTSLHN